MADREVQRRLAAVLAADVAGYTRLMEEDSEGTVAAWQDAREEVIKPGVADHSGKIVKLTGDGFLVEFPTVQDAVNCAIAMQLGLASSSLEFRMGVNLGDIIDDGEDIHGEGVNVAARIEALADPGGISISASVFEQVRNRIEAGFEDRGEHQVKNVSQPVRVYGITPPSAAEDDASMLGAVAPALPDRPSIAVLPFTNMSGDGEQEYFSDGITEDLITDISKVSGLFVIARNSTFAYKGRSPDIRDVARELGVRYVLEGSVRKAGGRVRINAQLIEADTGGHIWADRYDGDLEDIFTLQDEITAKIVAALEVNLTASEEKQAARAVTANVEAYDVFLRGRTLSNAFSAENTAEAMKYFEAAIALDPNFAAAYANLARVQISSWILTWDSGVLSKAEAQDLALATAMKAVELDGNLAVAHSKLGWVNLFCLEHEAAIANFERAMELDPNDAENCGYFAQTLNFCGEPERALELIENAMRLDPHYPPNFESIVAHAHQLSERYGDAVEYFIASIKHAPSFPVPHAHLVITYAQMGKRDQALAETEELLRILPHATTHTILRFLPYKDRDFRNFCADTLRKFGVPD